MTAKTKSSTIVSMYNPYGLIIYVDGSAFKNPGHKGGVAGIVEFPESLNRELETIFEIGFTETTSGRMELRACIEALKWARKNARTLKASSIIIVSDSQYVCLQHNNAPYWKKAGWRNRDNRPIENHDLWNEFLAVKNKIGIRTEIKWAKGKVSAIAKEVDKKAKQSAHNIIKKDDFGYRPGKVYRTKIPKGSASIFSAKGNEEIIRIYRKDLKRKECKISFDLYSEKEKNYVSKEFAYASPEIENQLHRSHSYRVKFNNSPKYPIIEKVIDEIKK